MSNGSSKLLTSSMNPIKQLRDSLKVIHSIKLDDIISFNSVTPFLEAIEELNELWQKNKDNKELRIKDMGLVLYTNSPGGALDSSLAMYDLIKGVPFTTIGINVARCHSGAIFPYMACDYRFALPSSNFLIHSGSVSLPDDMTLDQMRDNTRFYTDQTRIMRRTLQRIFKNKELVDKWLSSETFFTAKQAVDAGLTQHITKEIL